MDRWDEITYYLILLMGILLGNFIAIKFGDWAIERFKKHL